MNPMTRCPHATTPSPGTLAIAWPDLDMPCQGDHREQTTAGASVPAAVITGTFPNSTSPDEVVAYCLGCLTTSWFYYEDFSPTDPTKAVPTRFEVQSARDLAAYRADPGATTRAHACGEVSDETIADAERTGLPRPVSTVTDRDPVSHALRERRFPTPWINGTHGLRGDFYSFRIDSLRALEDRLCCICGDPLRASVAIGAESGKRRTAGGWGHPRCLVLAVRTCPHFTEAPVPFEVVAYRHTGPGIGVVRPEFAIDDIVETAEPLSLGALVAWAKADPWGDRDTPLGRVVDDVGLDVEQACHEGVVAR